jgi:hypothetical protein
MALLSDLVSNVVSRVSTNIPNVNTLAADWLLKSYKAVAAQFPFVELQNFYTQNVLTTGGVRMGSYSIATDVRAILAVSMQDPNLLISGTSTPIKRRLKKDSWRGSAAEKFTPEGIPCKYTRFGNTIYFEPTPNRDDYLFYIWYWKYPDVSQGVSSTISLPMEWEEVIEWEGVWRGLLHTLSYNEAKEVRNNVVIPLLAERVSNMKSFIETQDWDIGIQMRVDKQTAGAK